MGYDQGQARAFAVRKLAQGDEFARAIHVPGPDRPPGDRRPEAASGMAQTDGAYELVG